MDHAPNARVAGGRFSDQAARVTLATTNPLVGRARELERLGALVGRLTSGSTATLFIEGEAGIGKTRLLASLIEGARERGVAVFHGEGHPLERIRPFGILVDALDLRSSSSDPRCAALGRVLVGEDTLDGGELAAGQLQFRVVEEIIDLIEVASDRAPVLVALDDLHWADSSTLLALRWMTRELTQVPLLLVGTLRPSPRTADLSQMLDDCLEAGAQLIRVEPLGSRDVGALVEAELGLPASPALVDVVGRAAGNPLWVVEMLRSMSSEGMLDLTGASAEVASAETPYSLRQLVVRRLAYLPEGTVGTLRSASLLGDAFSLVDLATITGRRAGELFEELGEAIKAGLLADSEGRLFFRHQLVRDAIYEDIPEAARVALHREAGRMLDAAGAPLSQVASHLVLGAVVGDVEAALSLRRAARDTAPRAPGVAVELQRRAEELLPPHHAERDGILAELVETLMRAGRIAEAAGIAEAVLARPHDGAVDRPLRLALIDALSLQNRAVELIDRAQAELASSPDMPLADQAFILTQGSYGRTLSGDLIKGELDARRALGLAEQSGDTAMTVWSLTALSVAVKTQGRYGEAVELTSRAVQLALDAPDDAARHRGPFFMHGMALCDADLMDDAAAAYRRAANECEELKSAWLLPDIHLMSAELRFLLGEWDEAEPDLQAGVDAAPEQGNMIVVPRARAHLALIAAARGNRRAAELALAPVDAELTSERPRYGGDLIGYAVSLLAEAAGQPAGALEVLKRFWDYDSAHENRDFHRYLAPALVRLAIALDQEPLARQVAEGAEHGAALAAGVPSVQSAARRCRGLIELDPDAMLEAVELARQGRRVLDHAGTCEDAAAVFGHRGRVADARVLLAEALDRYEAIGADWHAARANASLRSFGARRGSRGSRERALTGWDSLTKSERAVAELVADGLTNREVAKRLFISPHTVNSHLRRSFQKLDVSNRAALASEVSRAHSR
jgi:DNA-binding CsgD family transcriptional regulator/tetratricopeptide (TPR) repeat protein